MTNWKPNEKQELFLKTVAEHPNCTLAELSEFAGVTFASGTVNTLVAHGLIDNTQEKEVLVTAKRKVKAYSVVETKGA